MAQAPPSPGSGWNRTFFFSGDSPRRAFDSRISPYLTLSLDFLGSGVIPDASPSNLKRCCTPSAASTDDLDLMWLASRPPWASQSAWSQSCLASLGCASECSLQPKLVVVRVLFSVDPGQHRPVRPMVNPPPYREMQHRVHETVPVADLFAKNTRLPGVRTMCSSDVSLLPTQTPLMNTASPLCQRFPPSRQARHWMLKCASVSSRIPRDLPPSVSPCFPEPPLPALRHTSTVRARERYPQRI